MTGIDQIAEASLIESMYASRYSPQPFWKSSVGCTLSSPKLAGPLWIGVRSTICLVG